MPCCNLKKRILIKLLSTIMKLTPKKTINHNNKKKNDCFINNFILYFYLI